MSRPLNMSEVDWLKSENVRLEKLVGSAKSADQNETDRLDSEIAQLYQRVRDLDTENNRLRSMLTKVEEENRQLKEQYEASYQ